MYADLSEAALARASTPTFTHIEAERNYPFHLAERKDVLEYLAHTWDIFLAVREANSIIWRSLSDNKVQDCPKRSVYRLRSLEDLEVWLSVTHSLHFLANGAIVKLMQSCPEWAVSPFWTVRRDVQRCFAAFRDFFRSRPTRETVLEVFDVSLQTEHEVLDFGDLLISRWLEPAQRFEVGSLFMRSTRPSLTAEGFPRRPQTWAEPKNSKKRNRSADSQKAWDYLASVAQPTLRGMAEAIRCSAGYAFGLPAWKHQRENMNTRRREEGEMRISAAAARSSRSADPSNEAALNELLAKTSEPTRAHERTGKPTRSAITPKTPKN